MKQWKKIIALAVSVGLSVPAALIADPVKAYAANSDKLTVYGGWNESLYAEWEGNAKGAVISYKGASDSSYKTLAASDADLIRQEDSNTARVDIPGLKAGEYDLKITTADGKTYTASDINVKANDRSGYAHYNYTRGIGAYNDDGTLKDNAIVLYVTNENKDSVQVPGYESYATGIGNILNGNEKLMEKMVADGHSLDIRFLGTVEAPAGLTAYNSTENGGTVGDNGNMAIIKMSKDVTLEGVGTDAMIKGWGFSFYVGENYKNRESYEVRNLTFKNYTEDAVGFQGFMGDSKTLTTPIEHVWVHNNSFYPGYCANPAESDKAEGDGSCDFKRGKYYTMDYNYYNGCHKTNLIGASDSNLQFNMTLHHNFYENCGSRSPLARQANIHIYNSYFKGNTAKTVDARANAYILSEGNYYESCKNPMLTQSGAVVKSYNDVVYNCLEDNTATVVSSRSEKVANNNTYSDFDTNSKIFYYDSANEKSDVDYLTSAAQAKGDCIAFSGVMKSHDEIVDSAEPASIIENQPKESVSLPYSINFTDKDAVDYAGKKMSDAGVAQLVPGTATTLDNVVFNSASKYSATSNTIKLRSQGVTFKVDQDSKVTLTEQEGVGKYGLVLYNAAGEALLTVEDKTDSINVSAGTYMIQSANAEKDAYIAKLSIEAANGDTTTPAEDKKEDVTEDTSKKDEEAVEDKKEDVTEDTSKKDEEAVEDKKEDTSDKEEVKDDESAEETEGTAVKMGSYVLSDETIKDSAYAGMSFNCRDIVSTGVKLRQANFIKFTVDKECEVSLETAGKGVIVSTEDGSVTYNGKTSAKVSAKETGTLTFKLLPGTYTINGYSASNNTTISSISFNA